MSTRSRIGILNQDGSIESVYHHSDGYPCWLGVVLKRHFSNSLKVRDLMAGGDISCIRTTNDWSEEKLEHPITLTYGMRGEKCLSAEHEDLKDFLMYDTVQTEYSYLWNPNTMQWTCWKGNYDFEWGIPKAPTEEIIPEKHPEEIKQNAILL